MRDIRYILGKYYGGIMEVFEVYYARIPTHFNNLEVKRVEAENEGDARIFFNSYLEEKCMHAKYAICYVKKYVPLVKPTTARFV